MRGFLRSEVTDKNKWLFLANGYWIIVFSWFLAPAALLFVFVASVWTIVVGQSPLDGQSLVLNYPKWQAVALLLLIFAPTFLLLYFVGRFGRRYVARVRAGQLPWPWSSK